MEPKQEILDSAKKAEDAFLRRKAVPFDFAAHDKKAIRELVRKMRVIMKKANGIGLAANQVGLPFAMFVAEVEGAKGSKFYAVFNPVIEKTDPETAVMEEGCLSVPGTWGDVTRPARVTLTGEDPNGKRIKIKAWGLLARVFQHEVDHLNGALFIDKAKQTCKLTDNQ